MKYALLALVSLLGGYGWYLHALTPVAQPIKEKPVLVFAGSGMKPLVECQDRTDCIEEAKSLMRETIKQLEKEDVERVFLRKRQS